MLQPTENEDYGLMFIPQGSTKSKPLALPLDKVHVEVQVVGFIAKVEITQHYVNREEINIEAVYKFPIEEEAAVIDFEAIVDHRKITAVVKEKKEARVDYENAISNRQTAFLLEETTPDIFQIKVGCLNPGSNAKIVIRYISELPVENNYVRLTVPTTIAPRYIPPTDNSEGAQIIKDISYSSLSGNPMSVSIKAMMRSRITEMISPSHELSVSTNQQEENGYFILEATLQGFVADMDRDFVCLIKSEGGNEPQMFLETSDDGSTAAMLSLIPSFKLKDQKVELIFLVDRSGSMDGDGMDEAKNALELFMHSLPADCYFNIFSFGSSFDSLFGESKKYTDTTLKEAKIHISTMEANYGGTEILSPLVAIFNLPRPSAEHTRQIFVLTDGQVSNTQEVILLVKDNCSSSRVFSLGLGMSSSRHLVKGIARASGGTSLFALIGEDIRPKVVSLLKNALQPCLSEVRITWGGIDDNAVGGIDDHDTDIQLETRKTLLGYMKPKEVKNYRKYMVGQAPKNILAVFDGSRLLVYRLFTGSEQPNSVTIIANTPDGPLSAEIELENTGNIKGNFVHQLGARKLIQDLEENMHLDQVVVKKTIIELGTKYRLSSKYTSFIGIDENKSEVNEICHMLEKRYVPNMESFNRSARQVKTNINQGGARKRQQKKNLREKRRSVGVVIMPSAAVECETVSNKSDRFVPDKSDRFVPVPYSAAENIKITESKLKERVLQLISLQMFDGQFNTNVVHDASQADLFDLINKNCKENYDTKCWSTAVVSEILRVIFPQQECLWELVVAKAISYVGKHCVDVDEIMADAKNFVKSTIKDAEHIPPYAKK